MFCIYFLAVENQQVTFFAEKWPRIASAPVYRLPSELRRTGTLLIVFSVKNVRLSSILTMPTEILFSVRNFFTIAHGPQNSLLASVYVCFI